MQRSPMQTMHPQQHFDLFNVMTMSPGVVPWPGGPAPLDGYVEAHVHGIVDLKDDVAELVLDPCFQKTIIQEPAERLGVPIRWHKGRVLSIDARIIGEAIRTREYEPQSLKQLWHLTAQWGSPRGAGLT